MTVSIKLQRPDGTPIGDFIAEDNQSIAQQARIHGIELPTSCGIGACGICTCKILQGTQYIQIDKISPPIIPLQRNEDGSFKDVFACIGGIRSEAIKDTEHHEVILEKNM